MRITIGTKFFRNLCIVVQERSWRPLRISEKLVCFWMLAVVQGRCSGLLLTRVGEPKGLRLLVRPLRLYESRALMSKKHLLKRPVSRIQVLTLLSLTVLLSMFITPIPF